MPDGILLERFKLSGQESQPEQMTVNSKSCPHPAGALANAIPVALAAKFVVNVSLLEVQAGPVSTSQIVLSAARNCTVGVPQVLPSFSVNTC